jgi:hypothetical protein
LILVLLEASSDRQETNVQETVRKRQESENEAVEHKRDKEVIVEEGKCFRLTLYLFILTRLMLLKSVVLITAYGSRPQNSLVAFNPFPFTFATKSPAAALTSCSVVGLPRLNLVAPMPTSSVTPMAPST